MLLKGFEYYPNETGICIDHYAALLVDGEDFEVLSLTPNPGSIPLDYDENEESSETMQFAVDDDGTARGRPGVWIKRVVRNKENELIIEARVCPSKGKLKDILVTDGHRDMNGGHVHDDDTSEEMDSATKKEIERVRKENPSKIASHYTE